MNSIIPRKIVNYTATYFRPEAPITPPSNGYPLEYFVDQLRELHQRLSDEGATNITIYKENLYTDGTFVVSYDNLETLAAYEARVAKIKRKREIMRTQLGRLNDAVAIAEEVLREKRMKLEQYKLNNPEEEI